MNVKFTAYNQVVHQLIDPHSLLRQNDNGINVVSIRFEDWHDDIGSSKYRICDKLKRNIELFQDAISTASKLSKSPFLISICPFSPHLSDIECSEFNKLEQWLKLSLKDHANIYFLASDELLSHYPIKNLHDEFSNSLGHIPYTKDFYAALATMIARKASALKHSSYKVIVLDCDNTLWKGVSGEVGALGIEVTPEFKALQQFMLRQREQGILLCLCSKNGEEDVFAVFSQHPDMILKREHISAYRINWNRKSENIRALAKELGLGLDSFIFIDDNPIECAEVIAGAPEVLVLQLPEKQNDIQQFLQHIWFFDHLKVTEEDKIRALTYQENSKREQYKEIAGSMKNFIAGLELQVEISQLTETDVIRASQLTQRTNQFNITTIRRTETEVFDLIKNKYECRIVKVKDRFGDYGLVGLLFFKVEHNKIHVDTLLLSCRVLGRGVEHVIIARLGEEALKKNIDAIEFQYIPTKRNKPALKFLLSISESNASKNIFALNSKQASIIKINPEINYSEAITESETEEKQEQKATQLRSSIDLSFTQTTTQLTNIDDIQNAVFEYYLKNRNLTDEYISPKSDEEINLTKIWEHALNISNIGISDNFFHLGGSSLIAVQIIADIRNVFNVVLDITDLFNYPNVGDLLKKINASTKKIIKSDEVKQESKVPLSFAQKRIWFLTQLIENKTIYNVPVVLKINGNVQVDILQKAFDVLLIKHPILRTRIKTTNGDPFQEILPESTTKFKIAYDDITNIREQLANKIDKELSETFDLAKFPLMRATLFKNKINEYTFCLVSHHIITDAHSLDILFNELAEIYNAIKFNLPIKQVEPRQEYQEFIRWQDTQLQNKKWDNQLEYWKTHLTDATYLELQTDHARPIKPSYKGNRLYAQVDKDAFQKLKSIARNEQTTLFMVLLGIFQTALYRKTGQDDIILGTPIANRHHLNISNTLGLFVNTLAIKCRINKDLTFIDLLKEIRKVVLDSYANQDTPFEKVLEALQVKRNINQHPIFPVMFSHRQKRIIKSTFDGLSSEFLDCHTSTALFDLTLITEESTDDIKICFEYATDLFTKDSIAEFLDYFKKLITETTNNPHKKLRDIIRFDQDKEIKIISEWNKTHQIFPRNKTVHQCFEDQVEKTPDAIALVYQDKHLTYQELNKLANQLAHVLRNEYHIRPDALVGIGMEASLNYFISILAILKAGGAYLPLDPDYPIDRLKWMIEDAKPSVLCSSLSSLEKFSHLSSNLIILDEKSWKERIASSNDSPLENSNQPSDLAYVIYTSGSTGKPKGVMIEHLGVNNLALTQKDKFNLSSSSRILQFSSMCFDVSVWEWTTALFSGSTLYLIPSNIKRDPEKIIETCNQHQITHLTLPPSMLAVLPDVALPHMKVLQVAGEACPENIFKKWLHKVSMLINGYGPTEITVCSSFHKYDGTSAVIIGHPNPNTQYYILDEQQEHVPIGMSGELYIGGIGVARGYLNRDDLTKERFINTPMGRLYKTGDLARFQPSGLVSFLGRTDNQVKIRGFRVELNEIESHITQHTAVQQAIVILKDNIQLVAFIALRDHLNLTEENKKSILKMIRSNLKEKLPNYMLPAGFVLLDLGLFPILPNGKIDRKILAQQKHSFFQINNFHVTSSDSIEFALSEIWKEKLNIEHISMDDDFFLIGGNSLLAASLVVKIQEKFNNPIKLDEFYSNPTIANMGLLLKKKMHNALNIGADDILISKCLLPIQTKGKLFPLFMIHPSLGLALPYMGLARYFVNQPIYGLSNPYFGSTKNRFGSIDEMADFYNLAIQKIQNKGPFTLAGWSFGGIVALEMARKLKKQNKLVRNVILLDSYHPKCILEQSESTVSNLLLQYKINLESEEAALIKSEMKQNMELAKSFDIIYKGNVNIIKAQETMTSHKINGWENSIFPNPKIHRVSCGHEKLFDAKYIKKTAVQIKHSLKSNPSMPVRYYHNSLFSMPILRNRQLGLVKRILRFIK